MKIAFGTDLSEESFAAASWAAALAKRADARLEGLFVVSREYKDYGAGLLADADNRVRLEAGIREAVAPYTGECDVLLSEGSPLRELQTAGANYDVLVLGSAPDGVGLWATGSVAERMCHRPPTTTVIVRPSNPLTDSPYWVVAVDFSDASDRAIQEAIRLGRVVGATLHFVHVVSAPSPVVVADANLLPADVDNLALHTATAELKQCLADRVEGLKEQLEGMTYTQEIRVGYPLLALIEFIDEKQADAVVVGSVGRSRLGDFIMGSITNGLVKRMPTTVIVAA